MSIVTDQIDARRRASSQSVDPDEGSPLLIDILLDQSGTFRHQAETQLGAVNYLVSRCKASAWLRAVEISVSIMSGLVVSSDPCHPDKFAMPFVPPGGKSPHMQLLRAAMEKGKAFRARRPNGVVTDFILADGITSEGPEEVERVVAEYRAVQGSHWHAFVIAIDEKLDRELLGRLSAHHDMIVLHDQDWSGLFDRIASLARVVRQDPKRANSLISMDEDEIRKMLAEHDSRRNSGL